MNVSLYLKASIMCICLAIGCLPAAAQTQDQQPRGTRTAPDATTTQQPSAPGGAAGAAGTIGERGRAMLTAGECTQLGGTATTSSSCASGKNCVRTGVGGKVFHRCITK